MIIILFSLKHKNSGCRAIGFNVIMSLILAVTVNGVLSFPTLPVSFSLFYCLISSKSMYSWFFFSIILSRVGYHLLSFQSISITSTKVNMAVILVLMTLKEGKLQLKVRRYLSFNVCLCVCVYICEM